MVYALTFAVGGLIVVAISFCTPLSVVRTTVDVVPAKPGTVRDRTAGRGTMGTPASIGPTRSRRRCSAGRNEHTLAAVKPLDVATVAQDVLSSLDPADSGRGSGQLGADRAGPDPPRPGVIERPITNLRDKTVRYNVLGGKVWISVSSGQRELRLRVTNTEPMVPVELVDSLFEPFCRLSGRTSMGALPWG